MDFAKIGAKALSGFFNMTGNFRYKRNPSTQLSNGVFDYVKTAKSDCFTAGFGKASILPPDLVTRKYYVAGYGENNPAQGYLDEPCVHALWLDDNSGRGAVLFVSCDVVGILKTDVDKIRSAVKLAIKGEKCRCINIFSTHNHAGIDTMGIWGHIPFSSGKDPKYMQLITDQIISATLDAIKEKREGDLWYGSVEVPDMQDDIRLPRVYSKELVRLRFVPHDGSRETWFLNFASHSESLQGCNSLVSADFPYYARERIREETGAETFYCVGAVGGMITMAIEDKNAIREKYGNFNENTKEIGRKLGDYALSISDEKKLSPKISFIRQELYFSIENLILLAAGAIGLLKTDWHSADSDKYKNALKSELTYFEIDDLKMLLLPCELFPECAYGGYLTAEESAQGKGPEINAKPLCEIANDNKMLIIGLANDEVGYVLPLNDFMLEKAAPYLECRDADRFGRRHYEETNSLGPHTAQRIADIFEKMLKAVEKAKAGSAV